MSSYWGVPSAELSTTSSFFSDFTSATSDFFSAGTSWSRRSCSIRRLTRSSMSTKSLSSDELTLNKLRFSRLGLYGRDKDIKTLLETFHRISHPTSHQQSEEGPRKQQEHTRELFLVAGKSGVGKSALAKTLEKPVQKAQGFFLTGKFDVNQREEPYSGVATACRALCGKILELEDQPQDKRKGCFSFEDVRDKIRQKLGNDVSVLTSVMPLLAEIVGIDTMISTKEGGGGTAPVIGVMEARNRFNFAFRRFIRVVASFGPLVFLIDDLQWADSASLELIESILTDREQPALMVIGCYRSNELNTAHILTKWIADMDAHSVEDCITVTKTVLSNLALSEVNQMLADVLSTDVDKVESLAKIVQKKTHGNVFFVIQFLKSLNEQELLQYNFGLLKWLWNEDEIEFHTSATENVVDMMKAKLTDLPGGLCYILSVAACLGSEFSERSLKLVVDAFEERKLFGPGVSVISRDSGDEKGESLNASDWLEISEEEGLTQRLAKGSDSHRWLHDKIQESALALVIAEKLPTFRFCVGDVLVNKLNRGEIEVNVFVVVNLLNECGNFEKMEDARRIRYAELNLLAGKKAIESTSFSQGAVYLRKGIELLPKDHWRAHYELSLELFSAAAEAEYCTADVEQMEFHCNQVVSQTDRPIEDKFRVYNVLIDSVGNRSRPNDAIALILKVLSQLGCKFPKRGLMLFTVAGIVSTKATLKKRTPEQISQLGRMTDASKVQVMRLLDKLATFGYFAKSNLLPLSILRSLRWSIRCGVSEFSPPAFALVGLILCAHLDDIQGGKIYAQHALLLLKRLQCRAVEARTVFLAHAFVLHWAIPAHDCIKPMLHAYETGMATGDIESAMWGIYFHLEFALYSGRSLESIEADYRTFTKQMKEYKQLQAHALSRCLWQLILNLMGHSSPDNLCILTGEVMDQETFRKEAEQAKDVQRVRMIRRMQCFLAFIFGDHELGGPLALEFGEQNSEQNPGTPGALQMRLHCAVSCFAMARKEKQSKPRRQYKGYGKKLTNIVKSWVEKGNPNVTHYESLLDAELAAVEKKSHVAVKHYEAAALLAARKGFIHDQAVINERFGEFMLDEMGDENEAEYRIREALKLFSEWGAHGKVEQLKTKHENLLQARPPQHISLF